MKKMGVSKKNIQNFDIIFFQFLQINFENISPNVESYNFKFWSKSKLIMNFLNNFFF